MQGSAGAGPRGTDSASAQFRPVTVGAVMSTAVALALLAALLFAVAAILQHDAHRRLAPQAVENSRSRAVPWRRLIRSPRWMMGALAALVAAGAHVLALSMAPLAVVQPIGALTIPIAVLVGALGRGRRPSRHVVVATLITVGGVAAFVAQASTLQAAVAGTDLSLLPLFGSAVVVFAGLAVAAARSGPAWRRGLLLSVAGAALFGLGTALIRTVLVDLSTFGSLWTAVAAVLALTACYSAGAVLIQRAYRAGSAEAVLGASNVVDPLIAVSFGMVVLGDGAGAGAALSAGLIAAALVAGLGVVLMAHRHPSATPGDGRISLAFSPGSTVPAGLPENRPLTVLLGADTFPPDVNGAARFAERLAGGLAERGHEVHVAAPSADGRAGLKHDGLVRVHRISSVRWPWHDNFRIANPWAARREARRLINEIRPDLVHVQAHFVVGRFLAAAAAAAGVPVVATNHFMPENLFAQSRVPTLVQGLLARWAWADLARVFAPARQVTAPTPRAVELLRDAAGIDAQAVSCGIDIEPYAAASARSSRPDRPTVLFVGRLDREKHVDELINAFAGLPQGLEARLEIVGDGTMREPWRELASATGRGPSIVFHGHLDDAALLAAYGRCDLLCIPGTAELQSLVTLEAMAAGKPVIAADAMALPHLVRPGVNGWLYPPGDIGALRDRLADLLADRRRCAEMGGRGRRIVAHHALADTLSRFEQIYAAVSERRPARVDSIRLPVSVNA